MLALQRSRRGAQGVASLSPAVLREALRLANLLVARWHVSSAVALGREQRPAVRRPPGVSTLACVNPRTFRSHAQTHAPRGMRTHGKDPTAHAYPTLNVFVCARAHVCVCVCVCVCARAVCVCARSLSHPHTHSLTHTHTCRRPHATPWCGRPCSGRRDCAPSYKRSTAQAGRGRGRRSRRGGGASRRAHAALPPPRPTRAQTRPTPLAATLRRGVDAPQPRAPIPSASRQPGPLPRAHRLPLTPPAPSAAEAPR